MADKKQEKPRANFWDAKKKKRNEKRGPFYKGNTTETVYARQLRKIAQEVGRIINTYPAGDPQYLGRIQEQLNAYAKILTPWAQETAKRVVREINFIDEKAWIKAAKEMSRDLRAELATAPTGEAMGLFMKEQVRLITSLPIDAGARVHKLTMEGLADSTRFASIADDIRASGSVTASRATLIARTEVARTSAGLTMARARHIGSDGYIWRTAGDTDVRKLHQRLAGKYIPWDAPPVAGSNGEHAHAGMIYNCRCYPEPVIPEI